MPDYSVGLLDEIRFSYTSLTTIDTSEFPVSFKVDLVVLGYMLNTTLNRVQGDLETTSKYSKIYMHDDTNSNITQAELSDLVCKNYNPSILTFMLR